MVVEQKPAPKYCALCKAELRIRFIKKFNVYTGDEYVFSTEVECPNQNRKNEHSAFRQSRYGDWWTLIYD